MRSGAPSVTTSLSITHKARSSLGIRCGELECSIGRTIQPSASSYLCSGPETAQHVVETGGDESTTLRAIGRLEIPEPVNGIVTVWWLEQYGGGLFLPLRDATAGGTTYGGGRYLLDSAKGADLGGTMETLIIDLNFLYHPSCRYSSQWQCPLAPAENTFGTPVEAGERFS